MDIISNEGEVEAKSGSIWAVSNPKDKDRARVTLISKGQVEEEMLVRCLRRAGWRKGSRPGESRSSETRGLVLKMETHQTTV